MENWTAVTIYFPYSNLQLFKAMESTEKQTLQLYNLYMQKQHHIQFPSTWLFRESAFQIILAIKTYLSAAWQCINIFIFICFFLSLCFHFHEVTAACKVQLCASPSMFTSNPVMTLSCPESNITLVLSHHVTTDTSRPQFFYHTGQGVALAAATSNVHPRATLCFQQVCQKGFVWGHCVSWAMLAIPDLTPGI